MHEPGEDGLQSLLIPATAPYDRRPIGARCCDACLSCGPEPDPRTVTGFAPLPSPREGSALRIYQWCILLSLNAIGAPGVSVIDTHPSPYDTQHIQVA